MRSHRSRSITCIVLHYVDFDQTSACVQSLLEGDGAARIIVVDNSHDLPPDGSVFKNRRIRVVRPRVRNPGFAAGMNWGADARSQDCQVLLFVNNDLLVEPGYATAVLEALDEPDVGAVGPVILFSADDRVIWSAGGHVSWLRGKGVQDHTGDLFAETQLHSDVEFLSGACLALPVSVFDNVGGWSERYFFGGEEWDLSVELRNRGYRLVLREDWISRHAADLRTGEGSSHRVRQAGWVTNGYINRVVFSRRHGNYVLAPALLLVLLANLLVRWTFRWSAEIGLARAFALAVASAGSLTGSWATGSSVVVVEALNRKHLSYLEGRRP